MSIVSAEDFLAGYTQSRMTLYDEFALESLLRGRSGLRVLEIGSWMGAGSTQILARHADQVVCIDHWQGNDIQEHRDIIECIDPYAIFLRNTRSLGNRVVSIRTDSAKGVPLLQDGQFDFIFIDGDHRYRQTLQDIRACLPKLADGGMIAGHDCEARLQQLPPGVNPDQDHIDSPLKAFRHCHPGVITAVNEVFGNHVSLFADPENLITLDDGQTGFSTIWYRSFA